MVVSPRLQRLLDFHTQQPTDTFILFALAKEYETQGDAAQALLYYEKLMQTDAHYVGLYYHYGNLLKSQQGTAAALALFDKGIAIAKQLGDQHALSELQSARLNAEYED